MSVELHVYNIFYIVYVLRFYDYIVLCAAAFGVINDDDDDDKVHCLYWHVLVPERPMMRS